LSSKDKSDRTERFWRVSRADFRSSRKESVSVAPTHGLWNNTNVSIYNKTKKLMCLSILCGYLSQEAKLSLG